MIEHDPLAELATRHYELRVYNLEDFHPMFGEIKFDEDAATQKVAKAIQKAVDGQWETEKGAGRHDVTDWSRLGRPAEPADAPGD